MKNACFVCNNTHIFSKGVNRPIQLRINIWHFFCIFLLLLEKLGVRMKNYLYLNLFVFFSLNLWAVDCKILAKIAKVPHYNMDVMSYSSYDYDSGKMTASPIVSSKSLPSDTKSLEKALKVGEFLPIATSFKMNGHTFKPVIAKEYDDGPLPVSESIGLLTVGRGTPSVHSLVSTSVESLLKGADSGSDSYNTKLFFSEKLNQLILRVDPISWRPNQPEKIYFRYQLK